MKPSKVIAGSSCDLTAGTEITCTEGRARVFFLPSSMAGVQLLGSAAYGKEWFRHQRNGGLYSWRGIEDKLVLRGNLCCTWNSKDWSLHHSLIQGLKHTSVMWEILADKSWSWSSLGRKVVGIQSAGLEVECRVLTVQVETFQIIYLRLWWMFSYLKSLERCSLLMIEAGGVDVL